MEKILIIKTGAAGDVLRTTSLLRALPNYEITWVVGEANKELLEGALEDEFINKIIAIENAKELEQLTTEKFDMFLSLDDDEISARTASALKTDKLIGTYSDNGNLVYNDPSGWFDMGLISRLGKQKADELKKANTRSYQEFLFQMAGKKFYGEEYILEAAPKEVNKQIIGIEARSDNRWPLKRWDKYGLLKEKLEEKGYEVRLFEQRPTINDFINDVNDCRLIITGDTLTMHIALALRKPTIAIFGPTSYNEIYDYGRLKKVIPPVSCNVCYKQRCDIKPNCMESISLEAVLEKLNKIISSCK